MKVRPAAGTRSLWRKWVTPLETSESMIHETDLPCSDCGAGLFERSVDVRELPVTLPSQDQTITVAECPRCGARYYPEDTLSDVHRTRSDLQQEGS